MAQNVPLLCLLQLFADQRRPFEANLNGAMTALLEPIDQSGDLRGTSGTVRAFDDDELAGQLMQIDARYAVAVEPALARLWHNDPGRGLFYSSSNSCFHFVSPHRRFDTINTIPLELGQLDSIRNKFPHNVLLGFHGFVGINHRELELRAHGQVLLQDPALEDPKTLIRVGGKAQVHARFEIFQLWAPVQDAV